jgi:aerobic-type carbon monoxide dehydrogenase small subunit (CoxS/CutS family)
MSERVAFECNGDAVAVDVEVGESLLSVLRERLGLTSVKDGCAPQGQCGCCTVLVDGGARVACVTPAKRVRDRRVTTLEGLPPAQRDPIADAFVAHGASQCGFCTPGIVMRCAALLDAGKAGERAAVDQALAAHLCRCTGWLGIVGAVAAVAAADEVDGPARDHDGASRRAALEGGLAQRVGVDIVLGEGGFADDVAVRAARSGAQALVAVPVAANHGGESADIGGQRYVVAPTLFAARAATGKVQGRKTSIPPAPPLAVFDPPAGGVALATSWVEPAYLEPDASWCEPGGVPATPLANGGAFGGKAASPVGAAARALADERGRAVRVVWSREDVVRHGPKRPPLSATAVLDGKRVLIRGRGPVAPALAPSPYGLGVDIEWQSVSIAGPPIDVALRAPFAETTVLVEGALDAAGFDRHTVVEGVGTAVLLDTCVLDPGGGAAGASVELDDDSGALRRVQLRVAVGELLDDVVLRSYCIGAVHMALGWVLREAITVDDDGGVHDLTIRSFGILRARDMPDVEIEIVDDDRAPCRVSDAVFAATAAACWNAITRADGARPATFPARDARAARALRR